MGHFQTQSSFFDITVILNLISHVFLKTEIKFFKHPSFFDENVVPLNFSQRLQQRTSPAKLLGKRTGLAYGGPSHLTRTQ